MKYEVQYNRSKFQADTLDEAHEIAASLIDPSMPWTPKIIEIAEEESI
jgi:hypothetical protein